MPKQTSPELATLAARVLAGKIDPSPEQIKALAACVLSQDEIRAAKPAKVGRARARARAPEPAPLP